jgi:hypothetical protein
MSRIVVGRIFWKEMRSQRSLWLGVMLLAIAIQSLIGLLAFHYRNSAPNWEEWAGGIFLAAYIAASLYAIGSGAATFTEESEAKTAWMLRVMPVTRAHVFVGKGAFGIASIGVLLFVLFVAAGIWSAIAWLEIHGGFGDAGYSLRARVVSGHQIKQLLALVWIALVVPVAFYAFGILFSLLCSEGLMAALCGTFTTILVLAAMALGSAFGVAAGDPTVFAWRLTLVAAAVMIVDYWLTGVWLHRGELASEACQPRKLREFNARWQSLRPRLPALADIVRLGEPAVPWRRAAQRLVWKECRSARRYIEMCALPVTIAVLIPMLWPASRFFGIYAPWIAVLATPLIMGVGTYQNDQLHQAYRFLAHRGVAPDGSWLVKHAVWLGLAFAVCGYVLLIDHVAWQIQPEMGLGVRSGVADSIANEFAPPSADASLFQISNLPALVVAVFYVVLAYSIGQRLSFAFSKGVMAFGFALAGLVLACLTWAIFAESHRVPLIWTVGPIPPILFAYTWAHTERWQRQQLYSYRWYLVAVWMALPFVGILLALSLYWPITVR